MAEESAFIRTILASPNETLPRLVYADWLEERGDLRAEYLRLMCRLDTLDDDDPRAEQLNKEFEKLQRRLDHSWVGLMNRGRTRAHPLRAEGVSSTTRVHRRRREAMEADVGIFLKQYARRRQRGDGPNDRTYSRVVEKQVQRMKAEELDRLIRGEE